MLHLFIFDNSQSMYFFAANSTATLPCWSRHRCLFVKGHLKEHILKFCMQSIGISWFMLHEKCAMEHFFYCHISIDNMVSSYNLTSITGLSLKGTTLGGTRNLWLALKVYVDTSNTKSVKTEELGRNWIIIIWRNELVWFRKAVGHTHF
jgi:hypothetical protein